MRGLAIRAVARGVAAFAGGFIAALALAGCATLSEPECRAADWNAIGRADGAKGARAEQLEQHRQACARHGVEPQEPAWRAGYAKGLEEFCAPKGGYLAGRDGEGHPEACAGKPQQEKFLEAYRRGREVNGMRRRVADMRQATRDLEMAVLSGDYGDYETTRARIRIAALKAELESSEWELERLDQGYAAEYGATPLSEADPR